MMVCYFVGYLKGNVLDCYFSQNYSVSFFLILHGMVSMGAQRRIKFLDFFFEDCCSVCIISARFE